MEETIPDAIAQGRAMLDNTIRKSNDLGYLFRNGQRWTFLTVTLPVRLGHRVVEAQMLWALVPEPTTPS